MVKKFLVTAALPYVNGVPHLGHLISTHLPSDILARYLRLKYGKENVLHIGGTDEHGTATELKALEENLDPKKLCDKYFPVHRKAYNFFNIAYDFFGRTTLPLHYLITQEFFLGIFKANLIKEVKEEVFRCKENGRILADRYVEGVCPKCGYEKAGGDQCEKCGILLSPKELINPRSKYCNSELEVIETYNLAINLPSIKEKLVNWIENSPFNEFTKKWALSLAKNIKERTITRDLKFGILIPFEKMKKTVLKELLTEISLIKYNKDYKERIKELIKKIIKKYGFLIDKNREKLINEFFEKNYFSENKHYEGLIEKILEPYKNKVFYVWFDAPIGYLTNTIYAAEEIDFNNSLKEALKKIKGEWKKWFVNEETKIIHFIGKDNIPFHTTFWPGMIISFNKGEKDESKVLTEKINLPYNVVGYNYLNYEGQKFSKSQGIGIFLSPDNFPILEEIPIDAWRFYLISILPEQKDSDFSWKDFEEKYNKELLGNFANFVFRVLTFAKKNGLIESNEILEDLINKRNELIREFEQKMDVNNVKLKEALQLILKLSDIGNKEFQKFEPWKKIKENKEETKKFIITMLNYVYSLTYLIYPFMPKTTEKIAKMINLEIKNFNEAYNVKNNFEIKEIKHLFEKINFNKVKEKIDKNNKKLKEQKSEGEKMEELISIDDFLKVKLRVGKIIKVEEPPELRKLYKITVAFDKEGKETKTILSALKQYYKPKELEGKIIVVVYNLKPKKVAGYESQGMLLAAEKDGKIDLVTINDEDLIGTYLS